MMYILHLSDLHFVTNEEAEKCYSQIADDLKVEMNVSQIDILIVSGDITNRSVPEEYEAAKLFIEKLCFEFSLLSEQIIIVPGNHDLNWALAKKAYKPQISDKQEKVKEGTFIIEDNSLTIRDENEYKQRFINFKEFYQTIKDEIYPLEYGKQGILYHYPQHNLLILGLNSAWELDHHYKARASINSVALSNALDQIRNNKLYKKCLKMAVWHHPLNSPDEDRIKNKDFMDRLSVAGFRIALHGHIHKADAELYRYDISSKGRRIDIICAGTFGAPVSEWVPGYPLQYNLIKLEKNKVIVNTRCREKPEGAWRADARWKHGKNMQSYYEIDLSNRRFLNWAILYTLGVSLIVYMLYCSVTYYLFEQKFTKIQQDIKYYANDDLNLKKTLQDIPSLQKIMQNFNIFKNISHYKELKKEIIIPDIKSRLDNINLRQIDLSGYDIKLDNANFSRSFLNHAKFKNTVLINAVFDRAELVEADMSDSNLSNAKLNEIDERGVVLIKAKLINATIDNAELKCADLSQSDIRKAHLKKALLNNATLIQADLSGADLSGANLSEANLKLAKLIGTKLDNVIFDNANLEEAVLSGATGLTVEQLSKAKSLLNIMCENDNNCKKIIEELKHKYPKLFEKY